MVGGEAREGAGFDGLDWMVSDGVGSHRLISDWVGLDQMEIDMGWDGREKDKIYEMDGIGWDGMGWDAARFDPYVLACDRWDEGVRTWIGLARMDWDGMQ